MKFYSDNEDMWIPLTVTTAVVVLLEIIFRPKLRKVSLDIMENADLDILKDSAKNCWTNIGVTAALVLTVDAAMLQADAMSPHFVSEDEIGTELEILQLILDFLAGISLVYCMHSVLSCVIALVYVEPLSNTDAIKFFVANPASMGTPALSIGFACFYTLVAAGIWVVGTSGIYNATAYFVLLAVIVGFTIGETIDKAGFCPEAGRTKKSHEWQWTTEHWDDTSKWPWFAHGVHKDEKAKRIYRRMGLAIEARMAEEAKSASDKGSGRENATTKNVEA